MKSNSEIIGGFCMSRFFSEPDGREQRAQSSEISVALQQEITRRVGWANAPQLIELLTIVGVGNDIQFYDRGISISTTCVPNQEEFQQVLSKISKTGRTFPIFVENNRIKIDTIKMSEKVMQDYDMQRFARREVTLGIREEVTLGIREENVLLPIIPVASKVLDVGAGTGFLSQKIRDTLRCDVYALEPSFESHSSDRSGYALCVEKLGVDHVEKLTLQDALTQHPDKYFQAFDVVTVFKYNVPYAQKESFIAALAHIVKPGGVVYITSVEKERFTFSSSWDVAFLTPAVQKYFGNVAFVTREGNAGADQLMTCTAPRLELLQSPPSNADLNLK
ncbi:MAG: hypothetical protein ACD_45C00011G0001 [uncultured bacterium]|nr:MAG: hypothetical protein ACD_45C00011G0001 [uncultured bacterium]